MKTIDKNRVARCFGKAARTYTAEAVAQRQIAGHLCDLLTRYCPKRPDSLLEIGCGTGLLTSRLLKTLHPASADINDLCPEMEACIQEASPSVRFIAGDAERLTFPQSYDLIASSSTFQWFTDPEGFLQRLSAHLQPGGILAFSTFGPDNLKEIRTVTGNGLVYRTPEEWKETTGRHYRILHIEERHICLQFTGPVNVLRHLQATGVNGTGPDGFRSKRALADFCERYERMFLSETGTVGLTYHPVFLIATPRNQKFICKQFV